MENKDYIKIGVVGSRSRNLSEDKEIIKNILLSQMKKHNIVLVSGGCRKGADRFAEELAKELELPIHIHRPDVQPNCERWEYAKACYERNTLIANSCDLLIALWDGVSGGTSDTIEKVRNLKKPILRF